MIKHRPSPSKAEDRSQQFEKLLAAMGMEAENPFIRLPLAQNLEDIEHAYAAAVSAKPVDRKLVRRYRVAITKLLKISETIGPDFIKKAYWSRYIPDADERTLRAVMADYGHERDDVVALLTAHGLDIDHWLKTSGDVYRKRDVRKLLVEPFLRLMAEQKITTSRKLPLKGMFDALFDWLGVERKFRPSSQGLNAIARDLNSSANASNSNAKRRTKK